MLHVKVCALLNAHAEMHNYSAPYLPDFFIMQTCFMSPNIATGMVHV